MGEPKKTVLSSIPNDLLLTHLGRVAEAGVDRCAGSRRRFLENRGLAFLALGRVMDDCVPAVSHHRIVVVVCQNQPSHECDFR